MKSVYIYGCGGFGKEVLQIILDLAANNEEIRCKGFIVDSGLKPDHAIHGIPVYDDMNMISECDEIVIAIGSPSDKAKVCNRILLQRPNIKFSTLVHPRAWLGRQVSLGGGSIICAGALITTDIVIGSHVHINIGCTVGHDSIIGDFTTLNPSVNISGGAVLGKGCEIGTGSIVLPKTEIGLWSITGAGSVVNQNLPGNITAVGIPAKVIKERPSGWQLI
jgi:sugar O-acyltransferase (sialic acid O-acetyltransferase NeuD family)